MILLNATTNAQSLVILNINRSCLVVTENRCASFGERPSEMKMRLKQLMASTLPRVRKSKKKAKQTDEESVATTSPFDFAKHDDGKTSKGATREAETARRLANETCTTQRRQTDGVGSVAVYNTLPLNVTLNINVVNIDEFGRSTNNNVIDSVEYQRSPLCDSDDYCAHYLSSPDSAYNTIPRTRSGIRTNPWLPSPRPSPVTSPDASVTTSPTSPGMTRFFGDECSPKIQRLHDAPITAMPGRSHSVECDTDFESSMQISMTSDIGSSIATTERVGSPFSIEEDASDKLFSSGNDISGDNISLRPECDQAMVVDCDGSRGFTTCAGAISGQTTPYTKVNSSPTDSFGEPAIELFVKETPLMASLQCDDDSCSEGTLPEMKGGPNMTVKYDEIPNQTVQDAMDDSTNEGPGESTTESRQMLRIIAHVSPTYCTIKSGEREKQPPRAQSNTGHETQNPVGGTRSLDEIRSSLREKVMRLRREKQLVDEKVRLAQDEDRIRRQEKLRVQRQLTSYRKHVMLRTLREMRAQLERQTERLQATYTDVLDTRWTNCRGDDVMRERRHSQ